jgi:hypothetical protein
MKAWHREAFAQKPDADGDIDFDRVLDAADALLVAYDAAVARPAEPTVSPEFYGATHEETVALMSAAQIQDEAAVARPAESDHA